MKATSLLQWFKLDIRRNKMQLYTVRRQVVLNFSNWLDNTKKGKDNDDSRVPTLMRMVSLIERKIHEKRV